MQNPIGHACHYFKSRLKGKGELLAAAKWNEFDLMPPGTECGNPTNIHAGPCEEVGKWYEEAGESKTAEAWFIRGC